MQGAMLQMGGYGKVVGRPDNRVTVDPDRKDAFGIPIPVVHFRFGDLDRQVYSQMRTTSLEIADRLKADVRSTIPEIPEALRATRTGRCGWVSDPKTSAVNAFCQSHDVKNLFVTDGSTFPTSAEKNPTLTIMALSLRASEYMIEKRRKGEL